MTFVSEFKPRGLWQHFDEILKIPRGSGKEEEIRRYVVRSAEEAGLRALIDDAGNVVVRKPATPGRNELPCVAIQSHLDMVNEKNAQVDHNFDKDPIRPKRVDAYLTAEGTTLGADNGIGVAAALALLDDHEISHPPLECLFTVDEETGLTGAAALTSDLLEAKYLINLDSEEEGVIYIGCAGGSGQDLDLPVLYTAPNVALTALGVDLKGLKGGHSGVDIHLQRGNAIQLLARILWGPLQADLFEVAEIRGGNMHNAIPREARAVVLLEKSRRSDVEENLRKRVASVTDEYSKRDAELDLSISEETLPATTLEPESQKSLLRLLLALPHGVQTMSPEIPGLVETSSNLAILRPKDGRIQIHVSTRSSKESALSGLQERIAAIASLAGARSEQTESYPGWEPELDSHLLAVAREVFEDSYGETEIKAIHAGLECGIIKKKYPDLEMISIGPQIEYPHSPDERVEIESVGRFFKSLTALLERLAD